MAQTEDALPPRAVRAVNRPKSAHFDVSGKSVLSGADLALSSTGQRYAV
jgi:hypothetical protein